MTGPGGGTPEVSASINSANPNNGYSTGPVATTATRTLYVNFSYSGATAYLFRPSTLTANITGLEGRTPYCSLVQGALPQGMTLGKDCSISGVPTQADGGPFTIRLGASGAINTLDWNWGIEVRGPSVGYFMVPSAVAGSPFTGTPAPNGWSPVPGETVTYSVAAGSLPPGLSLDPVSGVISGMLTTYGSSTFRVSAQVQSGGRTAQIPGYEYTVSAFMPMFGYDHQPAWPGVPFASHSTLQGNYRYSATSLPAGISIDAMTGTISGTPTNADMINAMVTASTTSSNGATFTITTPFIAGGMSPVYVQYPPDTGPLGQWFSPVAPLLTDQTGGAITGIAYSYALDPHGQPLPGGMTLNPATGVVSGTPVAPTTTQITVNVTMTLNGATWMQPANMNIAAW